MAHAIERFIRLKEVKQITSMSTTTIYRWMEKGIFPRPVTLTPGTVAWREKDLAQWQQDRISESSSG